MRFNEVTGTRLPWARQPLLGRPSWPGWRRTSSGDYVHGAIAGLNLLVVRARKGMLAYLVACELTRLLFWNVKGCADATELLQEVGSNWDCLLLQEVCRDTNKPSNLSATGLMLGLPHQLLSTMGSSSFGSTGIAGNPSYAANRSASTKCFNATHNGSCPRCCGPRDVGVLTPVI